MTRLYTSRALVVGEKLTLDAAERHYLCNVLRLKNGQSVQLFHPLQGEFTAQLCALGKQHGVLLLTRQLRPALYTHPPPLAHLPLWVLFAPLKRQPMDWAIEKLTELGVAALCPISTDYSQADRFTPERLEAVTRAAAQQCERLDLPQWVPLTDFAQILADWPQDRRLFVCVERAFTVQRQNLVSALRAYSGKAALCVGPEGGFSPAEYTRLSAHPAVVPITLGPHILRAETALMTAFALWQGIMQDKEQKTTEEIIQE
jgi:16S rRNA (uracil1498-N3)-methyltransferase